jgi:asparagine synthase (glutamine-hydrolysing)
MRVHVADISEQDFVDHIAKIIWHLDQPTAGPGSCTQYIVSKRASEHVKAVLSGQGGDEILGGYARYPGAYFEQSFRGTIEAKLHSRNYLVTCESVIANLETLRQYRPTLGEFWASGLFDERGGRYWRLVNRAQHFWPHSCAGSNRSARRLGVVQIDLLG